MSAEIGTWKQDFPICWDMFFIIFVGELFGSTWDDFLKVLGSPGALFVQAFWERAGTVKM